MTLMTYALPILAVTIYVWLYRRLVTWQAPVWLIRHDRRTRFRYLWPFLRRRPRERAPVMVDVADPS